MKLGALLGRVDLTEKFVLQKFLCTFLQCSREELRTNTDQELSDEIIQKVLAAYKSYVEDKKPLEYILGHVDFFGKEFFVNEATLIPRPETEYMITATTEYINGKLKIENGKLGENLLLDIGTGCGVLGISVLLQNPTYFSHAIFSDYFADALEIAKRNYQKLITDFSGKVDFFQSDLLDFLVRGISELPDGTTVIVANLPYIPEETFEANVSDNVKKREPKPAFVGGDDGLDYYKIMLDQIIGLHPKNLVMFLEMMTWQVDVLRQLYDDKFIFEEVKTFHFNIRIVKAWLK
ncbi:MAG: HemK family protein methyltransferase [candidate division SR1 bacterium]|nr:HemK family protein methyltransferase [candidate division SR1 bacterium]